MFNLTFLIAPLVAYLLQAWPRIFKKNFGVDVWTRLIEADHVRKNNHKIPQDKLSGQFIIEGYFDYPPLFPTLLSYIPKQRLLQVEGFIAPVFDALQVLLVGITAQYFFENQTLSLIAQALYVATPMIALENSYLTPRSFGYLNFSLAILPLLIYYLGGNTLFLILGLITSTAIFLSHRFATQSFVFITIFFTYYLNTPLFIQVFFISVTIAIIITKGQYLRVLKGHLSNIFFWVQNLDFRFAHQVRGNEKSTHTKDWVAQIYSFLSVFSPVALFGLNPWALAGFGALIANSLELFTLTPIDTIFVAWIIFFYCIAVLVLKIKYLMPIGEGQRYMEMATVPAAILSAHLIYSFSTTSLVLTTFIVACVCVGNLALILAVQIKGVISDTNRSLTPELESAFAFINAQEKIPRVICVPHQNTTLTIYNTKAQVLVNADNPGLLKLTDVYPVLTKSLSDLAKKHRLTHALIRTNFATLKELGITQKNIVFKQGSIVIARLQ